ncbi:MULTISPECIES: 5,6-dimethylbenzimidazole synthase [Aneurinibacillus]|uniref:5,6-dimethylbenzimidazole synthase n=1 Tax=Aneurinibacillus thermoaerophilus TaxID=143495 RepID=A0A1G8CMP5_ANETH|nr:MULTISPECIES: 5,6-dimethylbenzimidazole synthase [Aneurinibacillus]AMA71898.1 5,6-dimethylbenzimidazole synthase [Aneurinibacillus sp. XH2]MED0675554.1 5,6-dimethylbenzimidazole synthase [Aneurinibacillus thermoaerophilus]MED0680321.1 5,6-dimethylbenzimidazole synthase [Aneurinibacillus thermoaerophilus]MED0737052.1 5,6-dimethylbenzimidazole synthase [Aneurinibacillus thermoaerophilus]MED0757378.1 5,6-dimethylbenzimidazole synthase [Aneurinibacillus thermoaerophilus]
MFTEQEKKAVYKVIETRRDVRSFLPDPLPEDAVRRILEAAHHGPSVGFMQPWNYILITSPTVKARLAWAVEKERKALAIHYEGERAEKFLKLKVEGLQEAPLTICVTCDPTRGGSHVLGRNSIPETDIMSTACAIQNMWLASCAEGIAMGWVSFYKKNDVRDILGIPPHIEPVALLSLGYTEQYPEAPILETEKWEKRLDLDTLIYHNQWGNT